jgi:hypothetical protein
VQSLGEVEDHSARKGLGLAIVARGLWEELIFDPKTGALMGEQESVATGALKLRAPISPLNFHASMGKLEPRPPVGTVTGWAVYYPSRIVKSVPPASPTARTDWCGHEPMAPMVAPRRRGSLPS